ncbi:MAG: hypothetical protein ACKV22_06215 [Bryobacteraceae bacterium]
MASLTIEMPGDLAHSLEEIAAAQHKSVQQLAVERLRSLVEAASAPQVAGSAAAVLQAMLELPHLTATDVDELDAAIAAGRMPVQATDLFAD